MFRNINIFFGSILSIIGIIEILVILIDFKLFFSEDSILPLNFLIFGTEYYFLKPLISSFKTYDISFFYSVLLFLYILAFILIGINKYNWIVALSALLLNILIFKSIALYNYGFDHFMTMSLFYLLITKIKFLENEDFSIDKILKYHLILVYFTSGIAKSVNIDWWDGNAIWKAVATPDSNFYIPPTILMILSIGTILIELLYPLFIYTKFRKLIIIHVILMHIAIGLFMDLFSFSVIMILWNFTAHHRDFNFITDSKEINFNFVTDGKEISSKNAV